METLIPAQNFLFDSTDRIPARPSSSEASDELQKQGFFYCQGLPTAESARSYIETCLSRLDLRQFPALAPFENRFQLGKVSRIPSHSCRDAIETDFLALHFEMGFPVLPVEALTVLHAFICLYFPWDSAPSETRTRLLRVNGLAPEAGNAEADLIRYCETSGDGWEAHNSGRLSCLGRFLDALGGREELTYMRDYRIAEWFNADETRTGRDGRMAEHRFFAQGGIDLSERETLIPLQPGDLLIIDNTRVAHGRAGQRNGESLYQFLYSVPDASPSEVAALRSHFVKALTSAS